MTHKFFNRRSLGKAISAATLTLMLTSAHAEAESQVFDIDSQDLTSALSKFSRQTNIVVLGAGDITSDKISEDIEGEYPPLEALSMMLAGSGIVFEIQDDNTVVLRADDQGEEEQETGDEQQQVDEEILVTGTLLRTGNTIAPTTVITRDDIERLGVHSAEDIIRTLPQNFSNLNSSTSLFSLLSEAPVTLGFAPDLQGNSAANLRGLGVDTTLVLVNGRRVAGSPVLEGNFVNLNGIPASAIERVVVVTDGASSIYGSDAIGGVIDIILRKDYQGAETTVRYENSVNGGDLYSLSQLLGTNWDGGRATVTLSREESKPVDARKAGWTTTDLRSFGGSDRRDSTFPQPGLVAGFGALPADFDGTSYQVSDFGDVTPSERFLRNQLSSDVERTSVTINVEQEFSETVSGFLDIHYNKSENASEGTPHLIASLLVPETNGFNTLNQDVVVNYSLDAEGIAGAVPSADGFSEQKQLNLTGGVDWELPFRDLNLRFTTQFSESESSSESTVLNLESDVFQQILASPDRDIAFNPFGNGSVQSPLLAQAIERQFGRSPLTQQYSLNALLEGSIVDLPGGELRAALNLEHRREMLDYSNDSVRAATIVGAVGAGVELKPERYIDAAALELGIPLVGESNQLPLVKSLTVNLSARWEEYRIPDTLDDSNEVVGTSFTNTSPKVQLAWEPQDDLRIRASWGESFRAPTFAELIGGFNFLAFFDAIPLALFDPLNPASNPPPSQLDLLTSFPIGLVTGETTPPNVAGIVVETGTGNPDLQPETATTKTLGFDWNPEFVPGLSVSVTYNKTDYENRIEFVDFNQFTGAQIASLPAATRRDENGVLTAILMAPVNFAGREVEAVDFNIGYDLETGIGSFTTALTGTYTGSLQDVVVASEPAIERSRTHVGPEQWKGRLSLGWSRENYGANMHLNYSGSYVNKAGDDGFAEIEEGAFDPVEAYWTADLTGHYAFEGSGWRLLAGARNVLNQKPPFIDSVRGIPFDTSRVDPRGRIIYLEAKKSFDL